MKKSAALFLTLFIIPQLLHSQDKWTKLNGPEGGSITSLIARGDTILAGTGWEHGLIFYSTNRGLNWTQGDFKNKGRVADFDFTNDGGVITAADNAGVLKSFDLQNWFNIHPGGTSYEFWSVGVGESGNIYASTNSPLSFLWGSTDNGNTWSQIAYFDGPVRDFQYFNGNMYLCYNKYILRKSEPSGNWDTIFTFTLNENNGFSLTTDNQNTIFAPSMNYFHVSTDLGNTWGQRDTTHFLYYNVLNRCVFNNRLIGACADETYFFGNLWGVIVSDDLGYTWRMSNNGLLPKLSAFRLASSGNETYVGTNADGVYKSTDYGDNWSPINNGLTAAQVYGIAFDKSGNLYSAAQGSGISKSTDKGLSWIKQNNGFDQPYAYAVVAYDSSILIAGTDYNLFRTTNGGLNWTKLPSIGGDWFTDVCKDKQNRLYALDYSTGIYRSADAGISWTRINFNPSIVSIAFDSSGGIYAGRRGGYIYKSIDDGLTWQQKYWYNHRNATINGICVTPNGTVFATACENGIIRSTDGGDTWTLSQGNKGYFGKWPIETDKFGNIYTILNTEVIIRSTDNGSSWEDITSNGVMLRIRDFAFDEEGYLYMATDESIWRSSTPTPVELISFTASVSNNDVILSWETATETNNRSFEVERKTSSSWITIAFVEGRGTTTDKQTYSFTDKDLEQGLYKYRLKQTDYDGTFEYSSEIEVNLDIPKYFILSQNYPNPFNPSTKISYTLKDEGNVKLLIYDIKGELISTLVNEKQQSGSYEVDFALPSSISTGVYIYRLTVTDNSSKQIFSDVKKMVYLK